MQHAITHSRIRRATELLADRRPLDADRLRIAGSVLLRGGWTLTYRAVRFADGAEATESGCSCEENRFILCLHQLAATIASVAVEEVAPDADEEVPLPMRLTASCIGRIGGTRFWRWRAPLVVAA